MLQAGGWQCLACRAILIVIAQQPPCSHTRSCEQSSSMQWPTIDRVSHASRSDLALAGEALHQPAHGVGRQPAQRHPVVRRRLHKQLPSRGGLARPRIRSPQRGRRGSARRGGSDSCIRVMYPSRTSDKFRVEAASAVHHRRPCSVVRDQRDSAPPPDRLNAQLQFDDSGCVNCALGLPHCNNLTDSTRTTTQRIRVS